MKSAGFRTTCATWKKLCFYTCRPYCGGCPSLYQPAKTLNGRTSTYICNEQLCYRNPALTSILSRNYSTVPSQENIPNSGLTVHKLSSRSLVRVAGIDASDFLQGLITNDMSRVAEALTSMYSMMLNVQGRVVYDLFVHNVSSDPGQPCFLIECDASMCKDFIKEIRKYKIRKKVDIANVSDSYLPLAVLPPEGNEDTTLDPNLDYTACAPDPRIAQFGWRVIMKPDSSLSDIGVQCSEEDYHMRRYKWGISEGLLDLPPGNCFPLECNLVYQNGASFSKGCYIGQELTARTYHTGITRKRLMPLTFNTILQGVSAGADIKTEDGKPGGKYRNSVGYYGLGLMRLAEIKKKLVLKTENEQTFDVVASVPSWWPNENADEKR